MPDEWFRIIVCLRDCIVVIALVVLGGRRMSTDWFMPWDEVKMPPLHTESIITNREIQNRKELPMPTEEELEQMINEQIDNEKAVDK